MRSSIPLLLMLGVSGCMTVEYTPQKAASLQNGVGYGTLCYAIEEARSIGTPESLDALMAEYERRNPNVAQSWISRLREGKVATGMPEAVAACAWNATMVGHNIGYGTNSKQYQGGGSYSYFFVNGRTGKVDFISA
jgi:hypothetical protein